jgi:site-specific recombinase XerD
MTAAGGPVVHVRRQVRIVNARLVFAMPKGGKERDIPLAPSMAEHLRHYPARPVALPWKDPSGKSVAAPLMFTSREHQAMNRNYINTFLWKPSLKAASIPATRENGYHSLRHYFASALLANGVDIRALAQYLGHPDPGYTLRVYSHLMPDADDRMRRAVDAVMSGSDGPAAALEVVR